MTGKQRREQLIEIGRTTFARRGFDGTSVEEIAARAGVSKPIVYEHFGGKEGLYAAVVEREMGYLERVITESLRWGRSKERIEKAVVALLTYVEQDTEGFAILVRDAGAGQGSSEKSYSTLLNHAVTQVSHILGDKFDRQGFDRANAVIYSQAMVGMVSMTAQWWLENRQIPKAAIAAHIVNLCWNGLAGLEIEPNLSQNAEELTTQLEKEGI